MTREQDYCKTVTDETYEDRFNGQGEFKGQKMNRNLLKTKHGCAEYVSKHHN